MAQLVLGAVGGYFFGPIGYMVGSAIGSLLMPGKGQEGPRLSDLKLQTAQYGSMINILIGTIRSNCAVIQQTDLIPHEHKSGGKGGQEITTMSYTASWISQLCDCEHTGPILGLNRIWADSRLIWSAVGNDPNNKQVPFTVYRGTETQLPDPTFEAIVGVGFQPAYRGTAYVTFTDMDLGDFSNRIPNLTFEVIASNNVELQRVNQWTVPSNGTGHGFLRGTVSDGGFIYIANYGNGASCPPTYTKDKYTFDGTFVETAFSATYQTPNPAGDFGIEINQVTDSYAAALISHDVSNTSIKTYWFNDGLLTSPEVVGPPGSGGVSFVVNGCPFYFNGYIYAIGGNPAYVARWEAPLGSANGIISAYYYLDADVAPIILGPASCVVTVGDDGTVWVCASTGGAGSPAIWHFDADLNLITFWAQASTSLNLVPGYDTFTVYAGYMAVRQGTVLYLFDTTTFAAAVDTYSSTTITTGGTLSLGGGYFLTGDGVFKIPAPVTYGYAVTVISEACGLLTSDIDVTRIQQPLMGYGIATRTTGRDMLMALQQGDLFDVVESDTKVKFVRRGGASVVTIPDADLGAFPTGGEPPALITVQRAQEVDLPAIVNLTCLNPDADYENNTQIAQRQVTQSQLAVTLNLPIVIPNHEAQATCYSTLMSAWLERESIMIRTPRKYAYLEPCDVVSVGNYTIRLTDRTEQTDNVIEWKSVVTLPQVFNQAPVPSNSGGFVPPTVPKTQLSDLVLLDSPLVADDDYPNGYYVAMAGATLTSWRGAGLFKSVDGGATFNQIATSSISDTIGVATTVLGDFLSGNIFDEKNSVTVIINAGGGTLASATELAVLNGANEGALGGNSRWEFIQWKVATLIAPRTYVLSGLLRGRRGTEWMINAHAVGDQFVALPTATNINGSYSELSLLREYKAVTVGNTVASATSVDFTNNGAALQCYAPVQAYGGRNTTGDIILQFTRRGRVGGTWVDYVDVPLGETSEEYQLNFYTAGYAAFVTNASTFVPTYTFTAADQTTFYGGLVTVGNFYWDVQQKGAFLPGTATRSIA